MNPYTGHLVKLIDGVAPDGRSLEELAKDGYQEIPDVLNVAAQEFLRAQAEACVDLDSPSPLSQWAADQRRHREKKKAGNRRRRKEAKRHR